MERVAFLVEPDDQRISCMLNPESIIIRRNAGIRERESIGGNLSGNNMSDAPLIFTGAGVTTIEMKLLFDVTIPGSSFIPKDVRDFTGHFFEMAENRIDNDGYKRPKTIRMVWGKSWNIPAVVTNVAERLEYFTAGGVPRRSWLTLRLRRINDDIWILDFMKSILKALSDSVEIISRLDTSSPYGIISEIEELKQQSDTVMLNDRLDALAENFYNDSSLWRLIAVFNGITDPARNVGSKLINIPPLQQLVKFL